MNAPLLSRPIFPNRLSGFSNAALRTTFLPIRELLVLIRVTFTFACRFQQLRRESFAVGSGLRPHASADDRPSPSQALRSRRPPLRPQLISLQWRSPILETRQTIIADGRLQASRIPVSGHEPSNSVPAFGCGGIVREIAYSLQPFSKAENGRKANCARTSCPRPRRRIRSRREPRNALLRTWSRKMAQWTVPNRSRRKPDPAPCRMPHARQRGLRRRRSGNAHHLVHVASLVGKSGAPMQPIMIAAIVEPFTSTIHIRVWLKNKWSSGYAEIHETVHRGRRGCDQCGEACIGHRPYAFPRRSRNQRAGLSPALWLQAAIALQLSAQRLQATTQSSIPPTRSQSLAHSSQISAHSRQRCR